MKKVLANLLVELRRIVLTMRLFFCAIFRLPTLLWATCLLHRTIEVSEAKRILTDETARRRYDQTGSTSDRPTADEYFGGGARHYGNPYGPTAEDIFEQFFTQGARSRRGAGPGFNGFYANENPFFTANFGGGNPFFQHQTGPRHARQQNHQPQGAFGAFGPLLGIFAFLMIMFTVSMMTSRSSTPTPDPFSLWQTDFHSVPHFTSEGLSFWLNPGHHDSATLLKESARKAMDRDVYQAWFKLRETECSQDLSQARQRGMPSRPKTCVQFDEIKAMKNQRAW